MLRHTARGQTQVAIRERVGASARPGRYGSSVHIHRAAVHERLRVGSSRGVILRRPDCAGERERGTAWENTICGGGCRGTGKRVSANIQHPAIRHRLHDVDTRIDPGAASELAHSNRRS